MDQAHPCVVCGGEVEPVTLPVRVRRAGVEVLRIDVPAVACAECGWVTVEDEARESLIAELERHTEPGDDIVFPEEGAAH